MNIVKRFVIAFLKSPWTPALWPTNRLDKVANLLLLIFWAVMLYTILMERF